MTGVRHQTASAVVLDDDDRVLLVHHRRSGLWLYPGGHVDANEDPAQTAIREVCEETGIEVRIVGNEPYDHGAIDVLRSPFVIIEMAVSDSKVGPHRHIDMVFVCEPVSGEIVGAAEEVMGCEWVPLDRLADFRTPPELPSLILAAATHQRRVRASA